MGLALVERSLNGGFAGGPDGLELVTDRELFGTVRVRRPKAMRRVVPRDLLERLEPGDLVVHVDHGVARYEGLVRRPAAGTGSEERDYLELHFAERGRIWVPVEQIERVSRYAGGDDPQLSKLGGGEWQRARTRVKKAVGDLARDLLRLYADRAKARGRTFGEDTPWQAEMEAAFPYEETPDQLRAAIDVKADLEKDTPMDRLVVRRRRLRQDRGRAARGLQGGAATASRWPCWCRPPCWPQQHLVTFQRALRGLSGDGGAAVALRAARGSSRTSLAGARGRHGRHRHRHAPAAAARTSHFKDLGLVVIDEEQRFGVTHKERLKQLKTEVRRAHADAPRPSRARSTWRWWACAT